MNNIDTWFILLRFSYLSALPVLAALLRRKRTDLFVFGVVTYVFMFIRIEQLDYRVGYNSIFAHENTAPLYKILFTDSVAEEIGSFMISWATSGVFIYACALISLRYERLCCVCIGLILFVLKITELDKKMVLGMKMVVTIPMVACFVYVRLNRVVFVYVSPALMLAGHSLWYTGVAISLVSLCYVNPEVVLMLYFWWMLAVNAGVFFIILSVPPAHTLRVAALKVN